MREIMTKSGIRMTLNRSERRLLEVMASATGTETVRDLCRRAHVHESTYHKMVLNERALSSLVPAIDHLLAIQLLPVIQTILSKAKGGNPKMAELTLKLAKLIGDSDAKVLQIFKAAGEPGERFLHEADLQRYVGLLK